MSRRNTLKLLGAGVAGAAGLATAGTTRAAAGFERVASETGKSVRAVAATAEGAYAAAANGDVLARRAGDDPPTFERVLDAGLTAQSKSFYGADATADGRNLWLCGEAGVVGHYDVVDEQFTDHSKPNGLGSTVRDVAAMGPAGDERVALVTGGGVFLTGRKRDGGMEWGTAVSPNGGNTIHALEMVDASRGWFADATGSVYRTRDGGSTWTEVGPDGFGSPLYDVTVRADGGVTAVGSAGHVFEYDGSSWAAARPGGAAVRGVDSADGVVVACGEGGVVYRRTDDGWTAAGLDASKTLRDLTLDAREAYPDTVAGNAGYVYERGSFDAYPDTLTVETTSESRVDYAFGNDTRVRKGPNADATESVEETCGCAGHAFEVTGSVGGSADADDFRYGGAVRGFSVTDGSAADLVTSVSGTEVSVERLADRSWSAVDAGVSVTLFALAETAAGPYAVGGAGRVVARTDDGWGVVDAHGPSGAGNNLYGAAVTDEGDHLWAAGGSGELGLYDVAAGDSTDYTAPAGETSTWTDVAVGGAAGDESVYLVNGSGEVLVGRYGADGPTWSAPVKPGNGSTIRGVTTHDSGVYVCDDNATVFRSTDGGATWSTLGIDGAGVSLYDVAVVAEDDITVSGGSGRLFRYNGAVWTEQKLGGNARYSLARDDDRGLIGGGSGEVFEREIGGWTGTYTGPSKNLQGTLVTSDPSVPKIVCGGDGTILEQSFVDPLY
ncbi:hypothetical protein K933_00862 [Candidatus Halobonum tyrrellensis G22]|uniref:Uncharacterized protein n=1 Tax=Candidatus Halobonum tyrrellensis G22 TaxID=1324957 RepID=V4HQ76_9EURY|nr:hypothetical protein K933_00862 [Candidatus Halobonum tyrrellensis G22]